MVIEYIRYRIDGAQHRAFLDAYRSAGEELNAAPNCIRHEISQGVEEPDNFIVRIEWDSIEGHEGGFRRGPQFASFLAKVKPYLAHILEMKHYRLDSAGERAAQP